MRASVWLVGVVRSSSSTTFCGWSVLRILRPVKSPAMRLAALPTLPQTWRALACSVCSGVRRARAGVAAGRAVPDELALGLVAREVVQLDEELDLGAGCQQSPSTACIRGGIQEGASRGGFRGRIQGALTSRLLLSMR